MLYSKNAKLNFLMNNCKGICKMIVNLSVRNAITVLFNLRNLLLKVKKNAMKKAISVNLAAVKL